MRAMLRWFLLVIAAASVSQSAANQECTPLSEFLADVPLSTSRRPLSNWTALVATLDALDFIGFMIAPMPSTFLIPSDAAVAALHAADPGAEPGTGVTAASISDWEADRLLALVFYHVIPGLPSMAALAAAGGTETFLDQLTSGGEMLRFSGNGSQVAVSGQVAGNSAVMPNATVGYPCSAVYVIDTVLLPAPTLADIPPFSAIQASLGLSPGEGPSSAPAPGAETPGPAVFNLPMAPGPAAVVTTTGPSISAPEALAALGAYNRNMSSPGEAPATTGPAPAPSSASRSAAFVTVRWLTYMMAVGAAVVASA